MHTVDPTSTAASIQGVLRAVVLVDGTSIFKERVEVGEISVTAYYAGHVPGPHFCLVVFVCLFFWGGGVSPMFVCFGVGGAWCLPNSGRPVLDESGC